MDLQLRIGELSRFALENNLSLRDLVHALERRLLEEALQKVNYNQTQAAALLGIHRNTLRQKVKDYGIEEPSGFSLT
ncbi:MAG: Hydrogenase transcriptional regulatory protein hupR1 [Candidatus Aminicenantes bacterium ADurb.Bin508]|nr:MAG: Hydrogenase transcriptional regulatory protein hupR1 [Candidatus Aminicenantes bacterium ADurb.Bin508]